MWNLESCIALACIEFRKTKKFDFIFQIGVMRDNADRLNESWHGNSGDARASVMRTIIARCSELSRLGVGGCVERLQREIYLINNRYNARKWLIAFSRLLDKKRDILFMD